MYDGRIGRWLSVDPAGQFASPYEGIGNNPVISNDPTGGIDSTFADLVSNKQVTRPSNTPNNVLLLGGWINSTTFRYNIDEAYSYPARPSVSLGEITQSKFERPSLAARRALLFLARVKVYHVYWHSLRRVPSETLRGRKEKVILSHIVYSYLNFLTISPGEYPCWEKALDYSCPALCLIRGLLICQLFRPFRALNCIVMLAPRFVGAFTYYAPSGLKKVNLSPEGAKSDCDGCSPSHKGAGKLGRYNKSESP